MAAGCSLQFSVTPNATTVAASSPITYGITASNTGDAVCKNVTYSFYYADNETYVSGTPKPAASNYYWKVGNLAPGANYQAQVVTTPTAQATEIDNEACATGDNASDACADNSITITKATTTAPSTPTSTSTQTPPPVTPPVVVPPANPQPPVVTPPPVTPPSSASSQEQGMWFWDSPIQMTSAQATQDLQVAKQNGFNAVYVTADDYLTIVAMPAGAAKTAQTKAYMNAMSQFVQKASSYGIVVDIECGWRDWGEPANRWKGFDMIDFLKQYNQQYPQAKIRGFQYDVESYLQAGYEDNKTPFLQNYVAFIDQSVTRMQGTDATFSVVIPFFYTDTQNWTPEITYNGKTEYAYNQLLDILQKKPGSRVLVMAYRNFFTGDNGVQDISTPEVTEAAKGYSTKVLIAQETGDVDPSYVTFHGMTKAKLFSQLGTINNTYNSYSSFAGTAVDYMDPFLQLK